MTTTNAQAGGTPPARPDRTVRRRALKRQATAASLAVLLAVFGAVAVTDLSRGRRPAAVVAAPAAS